MIRLCSRAAAAAVAAAVAVPLVLVACDRTQATPAATSSFHGMMMTPPKAKPEFTFTTTKGTPYRLREETRGKVTLLFFGYTHCPDVCPLHMANIAAVMKQLPYQARERVRVLFVTTDPERDTPQRLESWLGNFDPAFVGLAGPMDEINALQRAIGLAPAMPEAVGEGSPAGSYGVAHSAVVLAYTADDSLRVLYPFGTRQQDWAEDIPALIRYRPRG